MTSPLHRDTHRAPQALRFDGRLASAPAEGRLSVLALQARWHSAPVTAAARASARRRRVSWLQRIAGLLAFCALALGVFLAGSDTCAVHGGAGDYSQSTLAPITGVGADAGPADARAASCRQPRKARRFVDPKTTP